MVTGLACQTTARRQRGETGVTEHEHRPVTVSARERAALAGRDDCANFRALIVQARHITERSYETTLYDHMQAFRLLWRHLDDTGHLAHVHDGAQGHLASGALTAGEAAGLRLFLTLYARVHGT
jgi:hypothetical protein